jgi:hypothetical protein
LAGEFESGKTWVALHIAEQEMDEGRSVVYIDFEDCAQGIVSRLRAMSSFLPKLPQRFLYVQPDGPFDETAKAALAALVASCSLVVIDGVTEMMAMHGLSTISDVDVATMWDLLPRWAARLGPAVLLLDHVVKDPRSRGRYATGSQHKLAGIDGAAYVLEGDQPFGKGIVGRSQLHVSKDRNGSVRAHALAGKNGMQRVGTLVVDAVDGVCVTLEPPKSMSGTGNAWQPSDAMEEISKILEAQEEPMTFNAIKARIRNRPGTVRTALNELVAGGYLTVKDGPRGSQLHTLVRAYRIPSDQ